MTERTEDLEWVATVRQSRIHAVSRVREAQESLMDLLHDIRSDDYASLTYLVALTDVHPCMGKVAGRRLLASLDLDPLVQVHDLTDDHISMLSQACKC
jgi:hypothetical protein